MWLSAVVVFVVLLGAGFWNARSFTSGPMPASLRKAATIPVVLPNGRHARLGDRIRPGVPTVISLWASWCGPCRREAPQIAALRRRFGPDKLNLIYLNVREDGMPAPVLKDYLNSVGLPPDGYIVMATPNLHRLTNDQQNLIPRTYVFDPAGNPAAMIVAYKPLALDRIAGLIDDYSE